MTLWICRLLMMSKKRIQQRRSTGLKSAVASYSHRLLSFWLGSSFFPPFWSESLRKWILSLFQFQGFPFFRVSLSFLSFIFFPSFLCVICLSFLFSFFQFDLINDRPDFWKAHFGSHSRSIEAGNWLACFQKVLALLQFFLTHLWALQPIRSLSCPFFISYPFFISFLSFLFFPFFTFRNFFPFRKTHQLQ